MASTIRPRSMTAAGTICGPKRVVTSSSCSTQHLGRPPSGLVNTPVYRALTTLFNTLAGDRDHRGPTGLVRQSGRCLPRGPWAAHHGCASGASCGQFDAGGPLAAGARTGSPGMLPGVAIRPRHLLLRARRCRRRIRRGIWSAVPGNGRAAWASRPSTRRPETDRGRRTRRVPSLPWCTDSTCAQARSTPPVHRRAFDMFPAVSCCRHWTTMSRCAMPRWCCTTP